VGAADRRGRRAVGPRVGEVSGVQLNAVVEDHQELIVREARLVRTAAVDSRVGVRRGAVVPAARLDRRGGLLRSEGDRDIFINGLDRFDTRPGSC